MEKRIKTLYIITIAAIIAFLGMQIYWLYGRYEFSLLEYERNLSATVEKCVADYNSIREKSYYNRADSLMENGKDFDAITIPTFSLKQEYGDTVTTTRTATINTYIFSAYELLGLEPGTPLTIEQKKKAAELAEARLTVPDNSMSFDASGAKDENEAWLATKNVMTERKCPFTVEGIDSVFNNAGIKAHATLIMADSMIWNKTTEYHGSVFAPELAMTIPYSQLQGKTVGIVCRINPFDVIPGMGTTLVTTLLVSCLLIVCLVLQFSTVLKLSRLDKLRNSFITTMIHELKRPIATLKMCVSGLDNERMIEDKAVKKELLDETRNALDNLAAYFSKLRDITFNNVEQIPLNIQSINLRDLFETVDAATTRPSGKAVIVNNDIASGTVVSADRSHLYNILFNLVENAVKYSGTEVKIDAGATVREGFVELKISDNGNGIPEADMGKIFTRFYRGQATKTDIPGMGLGLAYVKLLVEAHGGTVSVNSRTHGREKGTRFTINIPQ